jgi:penicillin-insensitive murein DD-endopeptidase
MKRHLSFGFACILASACIGTPNPLHPNLRGSVGYPHGGAQTSALELPVAGPGYVRFRPNDKVYWGQPELVNGIQSVAKRVQSRFGGGPPIVLGDLSARYGGNIPRHNSHRSGRDVDLLWLLMTPEGRPVRSPGFVKVGPDGLAVDPGSGRYYRLDVERQWQVIKAFLTTPELGVQWMFCATWIEALVIQYARALGEPDELVWRAQTVMLQPADSLPHDDHIHLRLACSPDQAVTGCMGGGPHWDWLAPPTDLGDLSITELAQLVNLDGEAQN